MQTRSIKPMYLCFEEGRSDILYPETITSYKSFMVTCKVFGGSRKRFVDLKNFNKKFFSLEGCLLFCFI